MYATFMNALRDWAANSNDRVKLQHAYLVGALILLFIAGIVGLLNYSLGQKLLFIAILAGAMYVINAVAWALLQSFILLHIHDSDVKTHKASTTQTESKRRSQKKIK